MTERRLEFFKRGNIPSDLIFSLTRGEMDFSILGDGGREVNEREN